MDTVNKVSEGLVFEDRKGRVLQRTQTLNWDTTAEAHHDFSPEAYIVK